MEIFLVLHASLYVIRNYTKYVIMTNMNLDKKITDIAWVKPVQVWKQNIKKQKEKFTFVQMEKAYVLKSQNTSSIVLLQEIVSKKSEHRNCI